MSYDDNIDLKVNDQHNALVLFNDQKISLKKDKKYNQYHQIYDMTDEIFNNQLKEQQKQYKKN